jgi:hypothetical protein
MAVVPLKSKSPYANRTSFRKGHVKPANAGRRKGVPNKSSTLLKQAILDAATLVGQDGKGRGGLTGYLQMLAVKEKAVYARLLEKVLPMQMNIEDKSVPRYSASEAVQKLEERNLPVPPSLRQLAQGITCGMATTESEQDELDGRGYEGAGEDDEEHADDE